MQNAALRSEPPLSLSVMPWALRAWPPLLWQANGAAALEFHHIGTRVAHVGAVSSPAGQTVWAGRSDLGKVGVAWDWVQLPQGVVAMADPMSVVTNLRIVGEEGEVLTAWQSARYLNEIVHALPWQYEVERALQVRH